jgi:hypothetical protein
MVEKGQGRTEGGRGRRAILNKNPKKYTGSSDSEWRARGKLGASLIFQEQSGHPRTEAKLGERSTT